MITGSPVNFTQTKTTRTLLQLNADMLIHVYTRADNSDMYTHMNFITSHKCTHDVVIC